ncbi:hypothetical protein NDN01_20860 [Sphingomonas sp. QA11]|uniref:DUF6891 domain-containing protein n=1 Tax=Sphingomonas sp. QA11 TaxID=2950605 RepID=UPI00234B8FEE|nr:hypothetical protein [Sphingomonas sp. QA11]WCM26426.1 hypothetical protein NDN01_20860 [Sphingomonas sp. QA11]
MKSLFDRLFGRREAMTTTAEVAPAASPDPDEKIDRLRDQIRRDVATGFYDEDVILVQAVASFEEEFDPPVLRREAQRLLREALLEHSEAQRGWPERTDCDRLDDAFAALEARGIVSRQHFTCCGTCGSTEIWDEIDAVEKAGRPARGYAFYHVQDTERAAEGGGLHLNYGACEEGEEAALAVAKDIVTHLEAHGLRTEWDGSWAQRIAVSLDWKRRR